MAKAPQERRSASDVARDRATMWDVVPAVVVLVALQASLIMLDPDGGTSAWNIGWSLLPMLPAVWLVMSQLRSLRRADERQRVQQLEALAIGFGTVILLAFAGGLLDGAGVGSARQSLQITFIAGTLTWIGALAFKTQRSR